MENSRAKGGTFNLAGSHTYRDSDLAQFIVQASGSDREIELVEGPTERMISVSLGKLHTFLAYKPCHREFLTKLIRRTLKKV